MRAFTLVALIALVALALGLPVRGATQETKGSRPSAPGEAPARASTVAVPVYKPPLRGAPGGRVGGGTRGTPRDLFVLSALAPDHSGLTVREQPSLYWFISSPTAFLVEVTLTDPQATRPLLEMRLPSPVAAGVHRIRLADHGVQLAQGVQYRWFVAVVPDPARRSRDILAGGTIERIEPPEAMKTRAVQARRDELPFIYAEAGLWYDALTAVSELIESAPDNRELQRQRAALLIQVGLPSVDE